MIVVTGANGQLGRAIIEDLLTHLPAARLVACVRDPAKASALAEKGVSVRAADFAQPESLPAAFAGATQVLITSVDKLGEAALHLHRAAIEVARAVGACRILYTSHQAARPDALFPPAIDHAATEALLAEAGVPFTALRHGYYAESAFYHIGQGFETGEIRAPEDGPVSWTTRADLAAIASELTGRDIKRVTITDDEWRSAKVAQGVPVPLAEVMLGTYRAMRRGDFATTDPTLEQLLGRRPRTMRDVLASRLRPAGA